MNAEPAVQLRLLDLQALDSRLDLIEHRRRTLPGARDHRRPRRRGSRPCATASSPPRPRSTDLERVLAKAETDVEQVRARAAKDQELLDSGRVTSAKELENLQQEVASLARRQGDLEDAELEVMERLEDARSALAGPHRRARRHHGRARRRGRRARRGLGRRPTATASGSGPSARRSLPDIPADLLALYDKLRADHDGVGAAALHQRRCEGCRMELTPTDIGRIRDAAPDTVLRCEECRRILVRTPESGL